MGFHPLQGHFRAVDGPRTAAVRASRRAPEEVCRWWLRSAREPLRKREGLADEEQVPRHRRPIAEAVVVGTSRRRSGGTAHPPETGSGRSLGRS